MLKPFTAQIKDALTERANEVEEQILMKDGRYRELSDKMQDILDRIEKKLPLENAQLLIDLDDFWIERDVLAYRCMYRQGLLDGMVVNRLLRMVRKRCRDRNGANYAGEQTVNGV